MYPLPVRPVFRVLTVAIASLIAAPAITFAQQDAPAVDVGQLLQALRALRTQQATQVKSQKTNALQQIASAAGSNEKAVALWETAVQKTQMEGAGKENSQFKAWKEGEGDSFKEREVQNAVRLHLQWLAYTLQRSGGMPVKDMLNNLITYTKDLLLDQATMEALADSIKREKDLGANNPKRAQKGRDDAATKKVHDSVLNRGLAGSIVVQWMNLADLLKVEHWEMNPGNLDGIYKNIILPELRAQKDQRVFEYWDMKLKKEADAATQSKLAFEVEKFNTQRRPSLLWNRSQELVALGQKNRAVGEMFTLIKTYPTHPDADDWMTQLEELLAPPAPAPAADGTAPAAGTPAPAK